MKYTKVLLLFIFSLPSLTADWQGPIDIFSSTFVQLPTVGIDAEGNAVIISIVNNNDDLNQKAAQLVQGAVQNIHLFPSANEASGTPAISVNSTGNATAAWVEFDTLGDSFLSSSNLVNNVWSTPEVISGNNDLIVSLLPSPGINLDSTNKALAAWPTSDPLTSTDLIQWNSFNSAWGTPQTVFNPGDFIPNFKMSGSPTGQAIAAWIVTGPSGDKLQAAFFNGTSWEVNPSLTSDVAPTCSSSSNFCLPILSTSINPSNIAIILWKDTSDNGLKSVIYGNGFYMPAVSVYTPTAQELITEASVSIDPVGNALAIWNLENSTLGVSKILVSRFQNGAWEAPRVLDSVNEAFENFNSPRIGTDGEGNAFAVWEKLSNTDGTDSIYVNQYKSSLNTWNPQNTLLSNPNFANIDPNIAVNSKGAATVVWTALGEDIQIVQAAYIDAPIPPAPTPAHNFKGRQVKDKFLDQTDLINVLTWDASIDLTVVGYNLYRFDKLIAFISANDPLCYEDRSVKKKKSYIYKLRAVSAEGTESNPVIAKIP